MNERAATLALSSLPSMTPRRLSMVLAAYQAPEAWGRLIARGSLDGVAIRGDGVDTLHREAAHGPTYYVHRLLQRCETLGIGVLIRGDADYPDSLFADDEAPHVLFYRGDPNLAAARCVGIVGTRHATAAGRATARQLGGGLAEHGVPVVSGLALGIDAAAHDGVRSADGRCAIGVVGSGLDIVYPRINGPLWEWVGAYGLLLSEWPPGTPPEAWRFPERNRIIAALCAVLVVVESRATGGSLITARAALDRGIDVMAVPGSTHCSAADGTNRLIQDGAGLVACVDDVLVSLGLTQAERTHTSRGHQTALFDAAAMCEHGAVRADVLRRCEQSPATLDQLAGYLDGDVIAAARAVAALEQQGLVRDVNGWFEAVGSRLTVP